MTADRQPGFPPPHAFAGRSDRDCEICGLPDRAPIHRLYDAVTENVQDEWVLTYEKAGPVCPFGHPWGANERIVELVEALAVLEGRLAEYETWKTLRGDGSYPTLKEAALEGRLAEATEALRHGRALHHFLWEEKETREPPRELLDAGYGALESSADYEREEELVVAFGDALSRVEALRAEPTPYVPCEHRHPEGDEVRAEPAKDPA